MKRLSLVLACFFISMGLAIAQTRQAKGIVVDDAGDPIIGASVIAKGTTTGTTTGVDGTFSFSIPANISVVIVKFIGMTDKEVTVSDNMRIVLSSSSTELEEVVVVGYGTQRKKDVTSSISSVKGSDLENLVTPSFDQQLAGRAAGVQVTQPSGVLGEAPKFRIRGINSISSGTEPLIVIDGIPVISGNQGQLYAKNNAMADINPSDIESYEILKDGAATAIYGSRASNGVILITTKKGSKGKLTLNYDMYVGWAQASKLPELLNASQFVEICDEMAKRWGNPNQAVLDPGVDTKWTDYTYRTGFQQNHSISASGGTNKSSYYFSLGYTDQEGITRGNDLQRFSLRANLDHQFTKWGKIGATFNGTRTQIHGIVEGTNSLSDAMFSTIRMLPNVPVYNPDDVTGYNIDPLNRKSLGRWKNTSLIESQIPNVVWLLDNNINRSISNRSLANAYLEIEPVTGLRFKTLIGADLQIMEDYMKWDPASGDGYGYGGVLEQVVTPQYTWNWQNILSYTKSFNKHNLDLTAVQEYTKFHYYYIDASVNDMSDPEFMDYIISGTFKEKVVGGGSQENGLASYMFRANYNFDNRYYIGGSIRQDALSKLPKSNRKGTFYGVSGAWRISGEEFWKNSDLLTAISDFKLRASWATVGNQAIKGNYPYMGTYSGQKYGDQTGIAYLNAGNPNLKWESQNVSDIGFDARFFDNRMNVSFAWWSKVNSDIVLDVPTAPTAGIPHNKISSNIGEINNNGIELSVGGVVVESKDFSWNANLNFSTQNNKVKKLVNGDDIINDYTIIREGESMNSIYGYRYAGVNKANGYPMYYKADGSIVQFALFTDGSQYDGSNDLYGYVKYDPANPTDVSTPASLSADEDKVILGSAIPTWFGGFDNTFTYKDFDFNLMLRYSGGNKIMNATRQDMLNMGFANKGTEILGRWQSPEKPGDGMTPLVGDGDAQSLNTEQEASSRFVEKGDFLKISNISIGYKLPKNMLSRIGVSKLRVYAQVQNAFVFTKYKGLDPETFTQVNDPGDAADFRDSFGVDWNGKPQQRIFSIGFNVGF